MKIDRQPLSNKRLLLIHDSDLDGISCKIVARHYFDTLCNLEFVRSSSGKVLESIAQLGNHEKYNVVFFGDLHPTIEGIRHFKEQGSEVHLFDHHKSTYEELKEFQDEFEYHFDLERCSTRILYDYLSENKRVRKALYQFVQLVDLYDRYQSKHKDFLKARDLNNLLWAFCRQTRFSVNPDAGYENFINRQYRKIEKMQEFGWTQDEALLIEKEREAEEADFKKIIDNSFVIRTDSKNRKYGFFTAGRKVSYLCNRLLDENSDLDYILARNNFEKDNLKFSLRSRNENGINVLLILDSLAEFSLSFGGHASAGGTTFKKEHEDVFMEIVEGKRSII